MSVNDPIWIEGEVKLINASGASLDGLWIEGEITLYGEYVSALAGGLIKLGMTFSI